MSNKRKIGPKRKRIVAVVDQGGVMDFMRSIGMEPKAPPRSGRCMACGSPLRPDEDHSVCDNCFPDDLKEEWKETDREGGPAYTSIDLDSGDFAAVPDPTEEPEREGP